MVEPWEIVIRLILSVVCGGIVGYQRETLERPAGLRTHVLVCLGATLVMLVSIYPFSKYSPQADPSRIASQVVVGIGFLGAGTIIRQGSIIRGLTTAASLWVIAAVGLAIGVGFYMPAAVATVLIFLALTLLSRFEKRVIGTKESFVLRVKAEDRPGQLGAIGSALGKLNVNIQGIELQPEELGRETVLIATLDIPATVSSGKVLQEVAEVKGVKGVEWESEPGR